jgi:hypothetical protein
LEVDVKEKRPDLPTELFPEIIRLTMSDETVAYPTNPRDTVWNMAGGIQSWHDIQANGFHGAYNGMQSIAGLRAVDRNMYAISADAIWENTMFRFNSVIDLYHFCSANEVPSAKIKNIEVRMES